LLDRFVRARSEGSRFGYSMIVDSAGDVVWYSSLGGGAMKQLASSNLRYRSNDFVVELDMLGNTSSVELQNPGQNLHHDLFATVHGTFLSLTRETVTVDNFPTSEIDPNAPRQTVEVRDEPVVEFLPDGSVLNVWPLIDILDPTRIGYDSTFPTSSGLDWVHTNAVLHDPRDDSILVSVRHQDAVIKFSRSTGELKWILGPHDNWSAAYQPFLLEPVGAPFEWQYHQHAPMITPSGNLLLFDNGNRRASPFDGTSPIPDDQNYSRAVEFAIDESTMQVRQVWEYGIDANPRLYSTFISDADWLPETGNVLIDFGGISHTDGVLNSDLGWGNRSTRIVEVDHNSPAEIVFDMQFFNPDPQKRISVYRSERIPSLYPLSVTVGPDDDGDGIQNVSDNCPQDGNTSQSDSNSNGIGDACDDAIDEIRVFGTGSVSFPFLFAMLALVWVRRRRPIVI